MLNKMLRITLAIFVLACFVPSVYASDSESSGHGPHDKLDQAIRNTGNAEREAQKQFDTLQTVNRLVGDLGTAYSAKSEAIAKGKTVTIAAGVGAIGSVVLTGGVTAPTVSGIIGAALSLGMSWSGSDNLLYRYNEALSTKVSQITKTRNAITAYNEVYNNQYLVERSNHLTTVTTHNQYHHKPVRTKWSRNPDYSLPSFRCEGSCGQTFNRPLGDHGEVCGLGSNVPGCHEVWYSCVPADVREHSPIVCTLDYKFYRKLVGHNKELLATHTCPAKFRRCTTFDLGYHEEVHHGYIGADGRFHYSAFPRKVVYGAQKKHKHDPNAVRRQQQTFNLSMPPPTPEPVTSSYHACGVHEDWQSGDHSAASCGISGHYACDGSDHSLQASCTSTDSNGNYCTVSSFYACQSHTHTYPSSDDDDDGGNSGEMVTCDTCLLQYDSSDADAVTHHTVQRTCIYCGESISECIVAYYCDDSPSSCHFFGW